MRKAGFAKAALKACREVIAHVENDYSNFGTIPEMISLSTL